ncbi:serine hydrolase domain-containing protein [Ramlibacter rhizophilus]|uniref:Class C beta-lactamase-related serine hydrolase n=1 Tax=Ramlibacter rhizophilus TaxID=1781167 RepID=A0A4Z0BJQ0_9BURK|nr:serine hydrolase [Ramlibacter rhizophilus]TFY98633.1 class C beta-lactamase-related serine hydrolase [Ramlibacter rhizophilus]
MKRLALAALLLMVLALAWSLAVYPAQYVFRTLAWGESDVDDRLRFPARELLARPGAVELPADAQPARVRAAFAAAVQGEDLDAWMAAQQTLGFVVLQHGRVIYEGYYNGHGRDERATSFSAAKSVLATLVAAAAEDGLLDLDEPVTRRVPELGRRDPRFARFTLRHLLGMRTGIRYVETGLPHGDDAKTYYWPDLRALALDQSRIDGEPGTGWLYNNYHPLLLGLVLERATGMPVAKYLEQRLWQPAGMAAAASWSLDSEAAGFEKMESGVNARTLDFARLGQLMLARGTAEGGRRVLSERTVRLLTSPEGAADLSARQPGLYYQLFWWGRRDPRWGDAFYALGKYGQFIFVSPDNGVVIARNGREQGPPTAQWTALFARMAHELGRGSAPARP